MKKKLTIIFTLIATPIVLAKLVDVHLPSGEELYIEHMKEKDRENRDAFDMLNNENAPDSDRKEAYDKLLDNGALG